MVSGSRIEGGPQILSTGVRKTIQSIKEIVGNHSDADIYVTLKESNMDPNETAQKLLNQDHFHEVKRKKDKWKKVTVSKVYITSQPRKRTEHVNQGMRFNTYSDRNIRRGGYSRNALPDARVSRQFRVVRDNRTNQNTNSEIEDPSACSSTATNELEVPKISEKSSPTGGASNNQKPPVGRYSSQSSNGITDLHPRQARDAHLSDKKDTLEDRQLSVPNNGSQIQSMKPSDFQPNSTTSSNYSVAGVYSSSSDPVHVPSPDSRPAANIGAIKREVGAVGVRRQSTENSVNLSSVQSNSFSKSHLGHDSPLRESFRSSTAVSKTDQPNQTPVSELAMPSISGSKPFVNNQYSSRQHQPVGHQKASQTNKEWKPKSSQKQSSIGPGIIGTPAKAASPPTGVRENLETGAVLLQDNFSRVNISENQNVIIAAHIRVSVIDRSRMIFGSLGTVFESSWNPSFQAIEGAEVSHIEPSASLSLSAPESSSDESSGRKQVDLLDERVRNSGTHSPASVAVSEQQLTDRNESSSPQDLDNYADIALVCDKSPSYTPPQSHQQQDHPQLPSFPAYDSQIVYDIPYFRSTVDETVRGHGSQFTQEALSSHTANSIPASTIAMVQPPPPMAQIYPPVHVSHYANLMPYRQFLSPVYVRPMAMPSYSNNPAYPHPSNGNSYLVMPGGNSHLTASGLKYGIQQYKPVPTGSPTGFGNFTNPTGYTINAPGVGSATGLEDSSSLKYKDGNLYVPSPQAETSEIWMNPRDLPNLQSVSYYNMTGQTPHAAYLPSHTGHASFNAASQSSHMQFPGVYHATQPSGIPSPHHLGPAVGSNVGVGVAAGGPGAQVGTYQQPQLGHMNWTGNF